jgi:hypothetical protein
VGKYYVLWDIHQTKGLYHAILVGLFVGPLSSCYL